MIIKSKTKIISLKHQLQFECKLVISFNWPFPYLSIITWLIRALGSIIALQIYLANIDSLKDFKFFNPNPLYHTCNTILGQQVSYFMFIRITPLEFTSKSYDMINIFFNQFSCAKCYKGMLFKVLVQSTNLPAWESMWTFHPCSFLDIF